MSKEYSNTLQDSRHIVELQSFRGLAALVVLLSHCSFYYYYGLNFRNYSELFVNAHGAVVAFYVLSGFVLAKSLIRSPLTLLTIAQFWGKRVYRIYPAMWVASALAIAYLFVFRNIPKPANVSTWWLDIYRDDDISIWPLVKGLLGGGGDYPVPLWSITVELMGSILMPLIIFTMKRGRPYFLLLLIGLLILCMWPSNAFHRKYLVCFALGASVILWAPFVAKFVSGKIAKWILLFSVLLLVFGRSIFGWSFDDFYHAPGAILLESCAAAVIVGMLYIDLSPPNFMRSRPAVFLGDISYSLYLIHLPVLGFVAGLGGERMGLAFLNGDPLWASMWLTIITLVISVPLAFFAYRFIELPGIALGKKHLAAMSLVYQKWRLHH